MKRSTKLFFVLCTAALFIATTMAANTANDQSPGATITCNSMVATVDVVVNEVNFAAPAIDSGRPAPNLDEQKMIAATATVSPAGIANPNKTMNVKNATATANTIAAANANLGAPRKVCSNRNTHSAAAAGATIT
jgi:hypothetical protein